MKAEGETEFVMKYHVEIDKSSNKQLKGLMGWPCQWPHLNLFETLWGNWKQCLTMQK